MMRGLRLRGTRHVLGRHISVAVAAGLLGVVVLSAATSSAQRIDVDKPAVAEAPAALVLPGTAPRMHFAAPASRPGPPPGTAAARVLAPALPSGPLGIPGIALRAYRLAADRVGAENPACRLPWFLLAGIGRIESNHAGNGAVDAAGTTLTTIAGPVLDGSGAGDAVIADTDRGAVDGDRGHDRAIGPMQFIPSTWAAWGADANGDGTADPNNLFDATYSAGRYLCAGVSDIMAVPHRVSAILRYNRSVAYASEVLTWALAYATGAVPTGPIAGLPAPAPRSSAPSSSRPPGRSAPSSNASSEPPRTTPGRCLIVCLQDIPQLRFLAPKPPPATTPTPKQTPRSPSRSGTPTAPPAR